jgi:hypothetical protein
MSNFGDQLRIPVQGAPSDSAAAHLEPVCVNAVFTTSGAVASYTGRAGAVFAKPSGTGVYTLTIPQCKKVYVAGVTYYDASGGGKLIATAKSKSSTVVTIVTSAEGTGTLAPADAVSGDSIDVCLWVEF